MKQYKAILLDFDGTLADSLDSVVEPYVLAMKAVGIPFTKDDVAEALHHSITQNLERYGVKEADRLSLFAKVFFESFEDEKNLKKVKIFAEVPSFLEKAKENGILLGVVSGNTVPHIKKVFKIFGLIDSFSFYVGGDMIKKPKPDPESLLLAFKQMPGIPREGICYVGDSLQDVECAQNAGIDGILLERHHEYPDYEGTKISSLSALFL